MVAFAGAVLAQNGNIQDIGQDIHGVAGKKAFTMVNGNVVPGGGGDAGGLIWDNSGYSGWWSGLDTMYINLDWGKMPPSSTGLPDHVVDGFTFYYGTNNLDPAGEDYAIFFFDSCTGWGNLGVQEAGFLYTGLPNGYGLPTLPPGYGWIWSGLFDLDDSGYEFLLGPEHGIGESRYSTPTMGSSGIAIGIRNSWSGTQNAYDIYYPDGTYNGTWWFGTGWWATWPMEIFGHEGWGQSNCTLYGIGAQGNDAFLYADGNTVSNLDIHFMGRLNGLSLQANLCASLTQMNSYYGPPYDITRLVGNFAGGSPWAMDYPYVGDFATYDVSIPPQYAHMTIYFQMVLSDPPMNQPPMDASNGVRRN